MSKLPFICKSRFRYCELRKKLFVDDVDNTKHYRFELEIDGDVFYCWSYSHAIQTLLEILTRDSLPCRRWKL